MSSTIFIEFKSTSLVNVLATDAMRRRLLVRPPCVNLRTLVHVQRCLNFENGATIHVSKNISVLKRSDLDLPCELFIVQFIQDVSLFIYCLPKVSDTQMSVN